MINLADLEKVYRVSGRDIRALKDINLAIPKGEIHGIVGESGAGKSTLLRCLTALETPTRGTVTIDGISLDATSKRELRSVRSRIGMVFQHVNLLSQRTAAENVEYPLAIAGVGRKERQERVHELLELVGIADRAHNYPSQLSGGQQQRVGIARALAARPAVLLCDEPTSALDHATTQSILSLIRQVRDRLGVTVVIITHEVGVVREACDAVTLLANGKIVQTGSVADIVHTFGTPLARELNPIPRYQVDEHRIRIEIGFTDPGAAFAAIAAIGTKLDIIAGSIEQIAGTQSGSIHAHVSAVDAHTITKQLTARGLYAQVAA